MINPFLELMEQRLAKKLVQISKEFLVKNSNLNVLENVDKKKEMYLD